MPQLFLIPTLALLNNCDQAMYMDLMIETLLIYVTHKKKCVTVSNFECWVLLIVLRVVPLLNEQLIK